MQAPPRRIALDPTRPRFAPDSVMAGMITALGRCHGRRFGPATVTVDDATRFEIEAVDPAGSLFAQLIANTGEFTSAHRNRVTANLFKLAWTTSALFPDAHAVLCVTRSATPALTPTGWVRVAARDLGVDVLVFDPGSGSLRPVDEVTATSS